MTDCERPDNAEKGYKCHRCGGVFEAPPAATNAGIAAGDMVQCPFCGNLCDPVSCRLTVFSNEEY